MTGRLVHIEHVASIDLPLVLDRRCARKAEGCRSSCLKRHLAAVAKSTTSVPPIHAGAQGLLEALTEVLGHEGVDDGVDAAVEVSHEREGLTHVFEIAEVEAVQYVKGNQDVISEVWSPADDEENDNRHQHLDHLKNKAFLMNIIAFNHCSEDCSDKRLSVSANCLQSAIICRFPPFFQHQFSQKWPIIRV